MEKKKKDGDALSNDLNKEFPALIAELCFVFLPFTVILLINLSKDNLYDLTQTADWALASTILFGQTIVKIVMGVAAREHSFAYQKFGMISALIMVVGLIPSVVIIAFFEIKSQLPIALVITQFVLLAAAIWVFLSIGTIGQYLYSTAFRSKVAKMLGLPNKKEDE